MQLFVQVLNALVCASAMAGYFAFIKGKRAMFYFGFFNNFSWLFKAVYFGWYGNFALTIYFIFVNLFGAKQWGNKPIKQHLKFIYGLMGIMLLCALAFNLYVGFKNTASILNFINVSLYGVGYTLRIWPKCKKVCLILLLINHIIWVPTVLTATPILWAELAKSLYFAVVTILGLLGIIKSSK